MADEADKAIKTVKGISAAAWEKGLEAAKRRDQPFGVWLGAVILEAADRQRHDRVIPPDDAGRLPELSLPEADHLAVVAMLFAGLGQVAGVKGCGGVASRARAVLDQHLARLALDPLPRRPAPPRITG